MSCWEKIIQAFHLWSNICERFAFPLWAEGIVHSQLRQIGENMMRISTDVLGALDFLWEFIHFLCCHHHKLLLISHVKQNLLKCFGVLLGDYYDRFFVFFISCRVTQKIFYVYDGFLSNLLPQKTVKIFVLTSHWCWLIEYIFKNSNSSLQDFMLVLKALFKSSSWQRSLLNSVSFG